MVITRSQTNRNKILTSEAMSDNESEQSLPEVLSRTHMIDFDEGDLLYRNRDFENDNIERKFSDMSRQIGELTNIVISLTEKLSSNTDEGNGLNTLSSEPNGRPLRQSPWQVTSKPCQDIGNGKDSMTIIQDRAEGNHDDLWYL